MLNLKGKIKYRNILRQSNQNFEKAKYIIESFSQNNDFHELIAIKTVTEQWSNGLVVKALDTQPRVRLFKTNGSLQGRLSLSSFRGR